MSRVMVLRQVLTEINPEIDFCLFDVMEPDFHRWKEILSEYIHFLDRIEEVKLFEEKAD